MKQTDETTLNSEHTHSDSRNFVILLHGLGRTSRSMNKIAAALSRAGYRAINIDYPSTRQKIRSLVKDFVNPAVAYCLQQGAPKIHIVSHSMGGILIRDYLQRSALPQGSRIVMLSPPNHGSEVAEYLKRFWVFRWLLGPAAQQLGNHIDSVPNTLNPIAYELGILTGNKSSDPWFAWLMPGPNDGKVCVESAKLPEMTDFRVVDCGHTMIMRSRTVIKQILTFLRLGRFE